MENKDKVFLLGFFSTIGLLSFFLGASITGNVVQTSYCNDEGCFELCKSSSECSIGICCPENDFGVCKEECNSEYEFNPKTDFEIDSSYNIESPSKVTDYSYLYIALMLITLSVGFNYVKGKKLHIKV